MAQKITINGKEYDFENLSETARNQIMNLRVADSRIIQLEQDLALAKTARAAYAGLLSRELPKESA